MAKLCLKGHTKNTTVINQRSKSAFKHSYNHFIYAFCVVLILLVSEVIYSKLNEHFQFTVIKEEFLLLLSGAFIVSFFGLRWRYFVFLIVLLFSFFQYAHYEFYGKNIDAVEFFLINNNMGEISETLFYNLNIFLRPLLVSSCLFLPYYLLEKYWANNRLVYGRWFYLLWMILLLAIFAKVFYLINIKNAKTFSQHEAKLIYPIVNRYSARNYFVSANYALATQLGNIIYKNKQRTETVAAAKVTKFVKPEARTVVLIIGESLRADRLFDKNISPKISKLLLNGGIWGKTIYSSGTMTKVSVASLINIVPAPGYMPHIIDESTCLFKLAKENGFTTTFISNQSAEELELISNLICPKSIDHYYDKESIKGTTGLDEDVLSYLQHKAVKQGNNFYVIHQRGSHSPYGKQFSLKNKDNSLSDYDNSVHYTDTVIYELLAYFKQQKQEVFLAFTPDHGELLGEKGMHGHGVMESSVYRVPMLLWSNYDKTIETDITEINSHQHLASYIALQLGYKVEHKVKTINILNADLEGFSGHAEVIDGKVVFKR